MKKSVLYSVLCLVLSSLHAGAILEIIPSSSYPIAIIPGGQTSLTYTVKNNTSKTLSALTIDAGFGGASTLLSLFVSMNQCGVLPPASNCRFTITVQGMNKAGSTTLTPKVCAYNGTACSIPVQNNRVPIIASNNIPNTSFPTPYAGTFYPIYNLGAGQWIEPDSSMPFNRVSALFAAFAHAYPVGNGAIFTYEAGQPDEPRRLALLSSVARGVNPSMKILISLGWGKNDWTFINNDYVNNAHLFVPSVIQFIRNNNLDGMDIDDEEIGGTSGSIPQEHFNGVITNLRNALNYASLQDGKPYYLTITPAGNNSQPGGLEDTQVDAKNAFSFNLINIQTYYNGNPSFGQDFFDSLIEIGYPASQIANGIDTENCNPVFPDYLNLAGMFNWNMTADSACNFQYTIQLADLVGYYG